MRYSHKPYIFRKPTEQKYQKRHSRRSVTSTHSPIINTYQKGPRLSLQNPRANYQSLHATPPFQHSDSPIKHTKPGPFPCSTASQWSNAGSTLLGEILKQREVEHYRRSKGAYRCIKVSNHGFKATRQSNILIKGFQVILGQAASRHRLPAYRRSAVILLLLYRENNISFKRNDGFPSCARRIKILTTQPPYCGSRSLFMRRSALKEISPQTHLSCDESRTTPTGPHSVERLSSCDEAH